MNKKMNFDFSKVDNWLNQIKVDLPNPPQFPACHALPQKQRQTLEPVVAMDSWIGQTRGLVKNFPRKNPDPLRIIFCNRG